MIKTLTKRKTIKQFELSLIKKFNNREFIYNNKIMILSSILISLLIFLLIIVIFIYIDYKSNLSLKLELLNLNMQKMLELQQQSDMKFLETLQENTIENENKEIIVENKKKSFSFWSIFTTILNFFYFK